MSGWTPVFNSVFDGTLCGKWPDVGVWVCLLAMADKNGEIDMTPERIAMVLGLPVAILEGCLDRFMDADYGSRSTNDEGCRLSRLCPDRPWGWRIVNFQKYRDRARKQAWDAERTASGRDAERKRINRLEKCPDVSRRVPPSPDSPRSQTQTQTQTQTEEKKARLTPPFAVPEGIAKGAWDEWIAYRRERRLPLSARALSLHVKALLPHPLEVQRAIIEQSIQATWAGLFPLKPNGAAREGFKPNTTWQAPPDEDTDVQH